MDIGVQQVLEKAQNKGPSSASMPYVAPGTTHGWKTRASLRSLFIWTHPLGNVGWKKACERNDLYGMMWWHTTVGAPDVRSVMENQQAPPLLVKFILACTATNQGMRPSNAQVALQAWQQSISPLLMQKNSRHLYLNRQHHLVKLNLETDKLQTLKVLERMIQQVP